MIEHISISNFAIIKNTEIDFEEGLNIITGETGSGKSIVIEAISLALGARADTSMVRHGCKKALIQLQGTLDGEEIVIQREISTTGKSLCRINGQIVTLAQLSETAGSLADIHGQYDNQTLLNPESHIEILDKYRPDIIGPVKEEYAKAYSDYSSRRAAYNKLLQLESTNARKLDFYRYEIEEIDKADLRPGEDDELKDRVSILQNSEKIFEGAETAYQSISSEAGTITSLGNALNSLRSIEKYSKEIADITAELSEYYYGLEDISSTLRSLRESITFAPEELDDAIARLNLIDGLKKKYGNTVEEILTYRDSIAEELSQIENFDEEKEKLAAQLEASEKELKKCGSALTDIRKDVSRVLEEEIIRELQDLNFNNAQLKIDFKEKEAPAEDGYDTVEILISTNIGEDLKPLARTASGGEISRIMLAIKNITGTYDRIPTMIFDEVDAGISGKTAAIVGKKLREISENHQILCITHLPQIAAKADYSYKIYKESDDEETFTYVEKLEGEEQVKEIARLLGGEEITELAMNNARELIEKGKK